MRAVVSIVAAAAFALSASCAHADAPPDRIAKRALAVGAKAPPFDAKDSDGKRWTLASAKAGPVVLLFYRGHW